MAAPSAIIEHGSNPAYDIQNETGLLVSKCSLKLGRTKVSKKSSGTRADTYVRMENPLVEIGIEGVMIPSTGAAQGVAVLAVGAAATLANFGATESIHGILGSDDALIVLNDASRETSDSEAATESLNYTVYPFIAG